MGRKVHEKRLTFVPISQLYKWLAPSFFICQWKSLWDTKRYVMFALRAAGGKYLCYCRDLSLSKLSAQHTNLIAAGGIWGCLREEKQSVEQSKSCCDGALNGVTPGKCTGEERGEFFYEKCLLAGLGMMFQRKRDVPLKLKSRSWGMMMSHKTEMPPSESKLRWRLRPSFHARRKLAALITTPVRKERRDWTKARV